MILHQHTTPKPIQSATLPTGSPVAGDLDLESPEPAFTESPTAVRDEDQSTFDPDDVCEAFRLGGEPLEVSRTALTEESEVQGFVDPSVVRMLTAGFGIGEAIGAAVGTHDDSDAAAEYKMEVGQGSMTRYPASLRPSRRRL